MHPLFIIPWSVYTGEAKLELIFSSRKNKNFFKSDKFYIAQKIRICTQKMRKELRFAIDVV